jgi:hypothetical protein
VALNLHGRCDLAAIEDFHHNPGAGYSFRADQVTAEPARCGSRLTDDEGSDPRDGDPPRRRDPYRGVRGCLAAEGRPSRGGANGPVVFAEAHSATHAKRTPAPVRRMDPQRVRKAGYRTKVAAHRATSLTSDLRRHTGGGQRHVMT